MARQLSSSFKLEEADFDDSFSNLLRSPDAFILVAEAEDRLVGYLLGFDHACFYANGRVGTVEELYVAEGARRRGVVKLLMAKFEDLQIESGSKLINVATRRASDFYRSIGYEESATYFKKALVAR